jgi:hypothetical protein
VPIIEQSGSFVIASRKTGQLAARHWQPCMAGDLADVVRQEPVILGSWNIPFGRRDTIMRHKDRMPQNLEMHNAGSCLKTVRLFSGLGE